MQKIVRAKPKATWPPKGTELTTAMASVADTVLKRPSEPIAVLTATPQSTNQRTWIDTAIDAGQKSGKPSMPNVKSSNWILGR